jgi:Na+/melibiose symporter-like transporter
VPRDLRLLSLAVALSAAGDMLATIVLALQVHELTGSALAVSALFAATMLPVVGLARAAGAVADRVESTRVLALASLAQAVVALGLAVMGGSLAAILVLSALLAAGSAVSQPAEFALVPAVAGSGADLVRANGIMESARYAGFAAGPLVAALLVAAGPSVAMLVNAASFAAIAVAAKLMRARRRPAQAQANAGGPPLSGDAASLWRDPVLRATVVPACAALLVISITLTAEVFYARDVLGAGDGTYALLTAAWMIGMVAGASGLAAKVPRGALAPAALIALAVQGAAVAGQTAWTVVPFAMAGFLLGGLGHGLKNTLLRTLIQDRVPAAGHGRAFASYNALRNTAEVLALAAGGLLVAALGARSALLVAGLGPVFAAAAGLWALNRPRVTSSSFGSPPCAGSACTAASTCSTSS